MSTLPTPQRGSLSIDVTDRWRTWPPYRPEKPQTTGAVERLPCSAAQRHFMKGANLEEQERVSVRSVPNLLPWMRRAGSREPSRILRSRLPPRDPRARTRSGRHAQLGDRRARSRARGARCCRANLAMVTPHASAVHGAGTKPSEGDVPARNRSGHPGGTRLAEGARAAPYVEKRVGNAPLFGMRITLADGSALPAVAADRGGGHCQAQRRTT